MDRSYKALAEVEKAKAELEFRLSNTASSLELNMQEQLTRERLRLESEHSLQMDRLQTEVGCIMSHSSQYEQVSDLRSEISRLEQQANRREEAYRRGTKDFQEVDIIHDPIFNSIRGCWLQRQGSKSLVKASHLRLDHSSDRSKACKNLLAGKVRHGNQ